jgi:hypothetical protein
MGREGVWVEQRFDQPVDIARWSPDDEFGVYPEGARDKTLLHSPEPAPFAFLVPNHRYLFKHSIARYPEQYWAEIIAYRTGCLLGVPVPPAFVAYDSDSGTCGSLIEWFLDYPGEPEERYVPGGDIMITMIDDYDRKRGKQHNFGHVALYHNHLSKVGLLEADWLEYWCDTLLFDALIGNTDRHQDNWGLLWGFDPAGQPSVRPAPVFDNGTSLGHEIIQQKMDKLAERDSLMRYVSRGHHHMKWKQSDPQQQGHAEMMKTLVSRYPELKERVCEHLKTFDMGAFTSMIRVLAEFDVPVPLTAKRAAFILELTEFRCNNLVNQLVSES